MSSSGTKAQAKAIEKSAQIQAQTAQKQMDLQEKLFAQQLEQINKQEEYNRERLAENREQYQPWMEGGQTAFQEMLGASLDPDSWFNRKFTGEDLASDPGYKFRLVTGENALNNSLAARQGLLSGSALKASTEYGQNFASNEFQNAYNRDQLEKQNRFNSLNTIGNYGMQGTAGWTGQNIGTDIGTQFSNLAGQNNSNVQSILGNMGQNQVDSTMALANLKSKSGSALGGAASGAMMGAVAGGLPGAAIGAGFGALGSLF